MSAAGVVADHPADRAAVLGGRIGGEEQTLGRNRRVELRLHHAGFDHREAALGVDVPNRIHVLGEVEHDRRVAGLAGERGAAAARENRQAILARQRERAHHVALVARNHDAERDLPVDRGVGGIERERGVVGADLAVDGAAEFIP